MFQELSSRPVFVHDAPSQFDISPGKMGKLLSPRCTSYKSLETMTVTLTLNNSSPLSSAAGYINFLSLMFYLLISPVNRCLLTYLH